MKSNKREIAACIILALILASTLAAASYRSIMKEVKVLIKSVGAGMALVILAYHALNWIIADNPQARVEARNSIKWILIGLILLALTYYLVCGILGYAAQAYYGIDVSSYC